MAGTLTTTYPFPPIDGNNRSSVINRVQLAWVSDASGNVNANSTAFICGTLLKVQFVPDAGGTAPSSGYDVTLLDTAGIDVLGGRGADLSGTVATSVCPGIALTDGITVSVVPTVVSDVLTPGITNAGNAKGGKIVLFLR